MIKPRVIVFSGYGLNCEEETKHAFEEVGGVADIVHINDLIDRPGLMRGYQIFAMPGGFSFGDDTGSGNAFAQKIINHLEKPLEEFLKRDTLGMGICNGFQILARLGILGKVSLLPNENVRYSARWVDLQVENESPWFAGIKKLSLPIAHGEGRFYAKNQPRRLNGDWYVALRYIKGEICKLQSLPANPNGSLEDIAGVTDKTGRILGLMPHPERAVSFLHLPHWAKLKTQYTQNGEKVPIEGPGLQIFRNAVEYFR